MSLTQQEQSTLKVSTLKSQCQHLQVTTVTPIIEQLDPDKEFQYLCYGIGKSHLKLDTSIFSKIPQVHRMAATLENLVGFLKIGVDDTKSFMCPVIAFKISMIQMMIQIGCSCSRMMMAERTP